MISTTEQRREPKLSTIKAVADAVGTTVSYLLGEDPEAMSPRYRTLGKVLDRLPEDDRDQLIRHVEWVASRTVAPVEIPQLANVLHFPGGSEDGDDFPPLSIPEGEWIERDTDRPRALHAWITPIDAEGAAGVPRQPDDWLIPTTQLLNSLREVRDERLKVVKIFGTSMHPVLRDGWKVLLDPSKSLFQPGKIVMVYLKDEGSTIGLLAKAGESYKIVKRNPDYGGPLEIALEPGEWYPVGTITLIVEAAIEID